MHEGSSSRKTAAAQKKFTRKKVANSSALIKKEYGKNPSPPQLYIITAFSSGFSSILSAKKNLESCLFKEKQVKKNIVPAIHVCYFRTIEIVL